MNELSTTRKNIYALEDALLALPQFDFEVKHYFAKGTYTRELLIPAGVALTGKIHIHSCINIILKGKIRVVSDEGTYDIEAPHVFVSGPHVKKAGIALEDTIWINVFPWDGDENPEEVVNALTYVREEGKRCLSGMRVQL